MINSWTCTYLDATTSNCVVTSSTTPDVAFSHNEWLFIVMIFLAIVSIPLWRFLFTGWVKDKNNE